MANPPVAQKTSQIDICQAILRNIGYDFRLNLVSDRIEAYGKKNRLLDDKLFKVIAAEVSRQFKVTAEQLDVAITEMAWNNQYHPIKKYLNGLCYDGGQHFQTLLTCFDNPDGLLPLWLRKWMLGNVSKVFAQTQNPMLILNGPQGIGKSKFVQWLCSNVFEYFIEATIKTDDKDTFDMLSSRWIWEVSELGASLRRSDLEALKHFITMADVTLRPAYGKYSITRPALASLIGTINYSGGGVFDDPTGSRRFLICDVKKIDWQAYLQIDVDQVWAEIYAAYLAGETWELTQTERELQETKNQDYQPKDTLEDHLVDGFEIDITKADEPGYFTPTIEIINYLQNIRGFKIGTTASLNKAIAQTCQRLGLILTQQRVAGKMIGQPSKSMRGYKGIKKL